MTTTSAFGFQRGLDAFKRAQGRPIDEVEQQLRAGGVQVAGKRPLPYGEQLRLRDGTTIDAYYSGKLVFGGANGADAAAARAALGIASSALVRAAGTTEPATVAGLRAVVVYTDGACSPNPGPGGWAAVILGLDEAEAVELSGAEEHTTNNRMELRAAIAGLRHLPERCFVRVATDSAYVVNALLSGDAERWERNAWQNNGKPVANANLWAALLGQLRRHVVEVEKVQGHAGDPLNERCDRLAVAAREAIARR